MTSPDLRAAAEDPSASAPVVFVSYARVDRPIVERLVTGLRERGLAPWVDLEGIPPSVEWMDEIRAAIEASEGFIVAVSPDLAASPICAEELDLARTAGKRIVPIAIRSTDPATVPRGLASLNWIDASGDIGSAVDRAVEALRTDFDHVRAHTRLVVRAAEWERADRHRSLLLRGRELTDAEGTVADPDRDPAPTPGQTRYVLASRRAAGRRQRGAIGLVAIALVVSLLLTTFALIQRREAIRQRVAADRRSEIANSRALASEALLRMDGQLDVGILLALEAYRVAPTAQALDALHVAAQRSIWTERSFLGLDDGANTIGVSPDGSTVAAGAADGHVMVWDTQTGTPLGTAIAADRDTVLSLVFLPDGTLATAGGEGIVRFWDPRTGAEVRPSLEVDRGRITVLAHAAGTDVMFAGTNRGEIHGWTLVSDDVTSSIEAAGAPIWGLAVDRDAAFVIASSEDGQATMWDPRTGTRTMRFDTGAEEAFGVDLSPDARYVAVASKARRTQAATGEIRVFDIRAGTDVWRLQGHADSVFDVTFSPDGAVLASASADGTVRLWSTDSGEPIGQPLRGHTDWANSVEFAPDGGSLFSASSDATVVSWDTSQRLHGSGGGVNVVAFDPDGDTLVATEPITYVADGAIGPGSITLWDAEDLERVASVEDRGAYGVAFTPDASRIVGTAHDPETFTSTLAAWDATTLEEGAAGRPRDFMALVAVRPDGRVIATASFREVLMWDGESLDRLGRPAGGHTDGVYAVAFSPDGDTLVSTGLDGSVFVRDPTTGAVVGDPLIEGDAAVYGLAFDPSGAHVAVGDFDGNVTVTDLKDRTVALEIHLDAGAQSIAFSPDGAVLAVGTTKGDTRLFDARTGSAIGGPLPEQRDWVNSLAFAPDGSALAAGSEDGSILVLPSLAWTDDVGALTQHLCAASGRSLTAEEWRQLVPFEAYHETCP